MAIAPIVGSAQEAATPPPAENLQYSEPAPLATQSLLLDIVWAGSRIVAVGERGHVLLSDDRAQTWRQAKVPTLANLTGVYFVDANTGWAVGHDEVILRSADGGETWTRVRYAPEKEQPLLAVWFKDANRGFAIGAYGTILASSDGGATWQQQAFEPKPLVDKAAAAKKGSAAGGDEPGGDEELVDEPSPADMHLNAISLSGTGKLYIAAEAGHIFRSDDEGTTWSILPAPYEGSFFGVLPLDAEGLLAFGLRGHLYRSEDAGLTWKEIDTGTVSMLTDGVRADGKTIAVSGLAGSLLTSSDGGHVFTLKQFPDRRGMNATLALDASKFVVVGEGGVRTVSP